MAEVPCVCVEDLTEEQVKALRIVDNKSNESPWDFDFLADELAEISLDGFDFDFGIYKETDLDVSDDDFISDTEITKSKKKCVNVPNVELNLKYENIFSGNYNGNEQRGQSRNFYTI